MSLPYPVRPLNSQFLALSIYDTVTALNWAFQQLHDSKTDPTCYTSLNLHPKPISLNQPPVPPIQPSLSPFSNTENLISSSPNSLSLASPEPSPPSSLIPDSTIISHLPSTHPMLTRSKPNIPIDDTIKYPFPKALLATTSNLSHNPEPTCFTTASKDP
jgi:hypothetical protein